MKKYLVFCTIFSFIFLLSGCNFPFCNNSENHNSADLNKNLSIENASNSNNTDSNSEVRNYDENNNIGENQETQIASFSTPLKSGSPNRITNIKLTCNKINENILKKGDTFSFNQIVGPCTAEEGYLESEIFVNKQIKYALGGGNCQVSTTLYNACLQVPGITIVERHEHGRDVDYIEDGKDATVSYNTVDFAFQNNTENDIKLFTSCDDKNVYASINKIENQ